MSCCDGMVSICLYTACEKHRAKSSGCRSIQGDRDTMPRTVLTADQEKAADEAAGTDLKYLFTKQEVSDGNQKLFYHHGITSIEKLANFAEGRTDLLAVLKEHWGLDQDNSLQERIQVAAIACALQNAKTRVQRSAEVDAEYDIQDRAKPVVPGEWMAMKVALEKRLGAIEDKVMPAKEYIEKKLAEVEANEYRAEPMAEVVAKDEVDPESLHPVFDTKGRMTLKRGATRVSEPANAEELRRRLTIMRNAHVLISLKHTNRAELQGEWSTSFETYKDYILGEFVYGLSAKDADGYTVASPPWSLVLSYEHAVRKHAARLVNVDGKAWPAALREAMKDGTIKERHFTTPLALYAKRPAVNRETQPSSYRRTDQPTPRPKQKGRGRGKSGANQLAWLIVQAIRLRVT